MISSFAADVRNRVNSQSVETWPSGRRHFPAKEAYGLKPVSRVRIPQSPPEFDVITKFLNACPDYEKRVIILFYAAVAQLDRVLGYEPRGRGFDSCQPHQFYQSR